MGADPKTSHFIEFAGIPGTGKTSLAEQLIRNVPPSLELRQVNAPILAAPRGRQRLLVRLRLAVHFVLRRPITALRIIASVLRHGKFSAAETRILLVNLFAKHELMRRAELTPGLHVSDEGVIHALWSLGFTANEPDLLIQQCADLLLKNTPDSWMLVIVTADAGTIAGRIAIDARRNRLGLQFRERGQSAIMQAERVMEIVRGVVSKMGLEVLEVSNQGASLDSTASLLWRQLDSRLAPIIKPGRAN